MNNVEFDNDQGTSLLYARLQRSSVAPRLVQFLLTKKIARSERQANVVLLAMVVVLIALSSVVWKYNVATKNISFDDVVRATVLKLP